MRKSRGTEKSEIFGAVRAVLFGTIGGCLAAAALLAASAYVITSMGFLPDAAVPAVVLVASALSAFLATFVSAIPTAAAAPALVLVGVMMTSSFKEIKWDDLSEAIPAFFAGIFMALCYSISYGIAFGFITYCLVKVCKGKAKEVHPILWVVTALFILNFVLLALPMVNPPA